MEKPRVEVVIDGELSPFEHETLHRILRKSFQVEKASYRETVDEGIVTRVNLTFYHPFDRSFFTEILRDNWRGLKDLLRQIRYRRGKAGSSFKLAFVTDNLRLSFDAGSVEERDLASAIDQMGHLTGIVGQMLRPELMDTPIGLVEAFYNRTTDRWEEFRGTSKGDEVYRFDDGSFRWIPLVTRASS
ncbi:MAG TPA: hypothetical protein VFE98_05050 [Candidatus Bathyarchaeia archaeon]|nr:hypothetical protein [Candidatus Bathyarchaeia archaeon]